MSYKRLNFISNIYFYLILLSGMLYSAFLIVALGKILPAFIMQIIFLADALKFNENIISLIFSQMFLLNIIPGIILLGLIGLYIRAMSKSIKNIGLTNQFINEFESKRDLIFTAGFISPKIYISKSLFKSHSLKEMTAMTRHEENHKNNHHPLKIFTANLIRSILPGIPGKDWLIDNYLTLVETASDKYSESKLNSKKPLVSALLKFQSQSFEPGISYFNSQSERIKILVGQKKQVIKLPMAYYSIIIVTLLFSSLFLKNSNIFFDCQHLLKCFEILVTPNSQPLIATPSEHCQNLSP